MIIKYLGAIFLVVHTCFQRLDVFVESAVEGVAGHGLGVAEDDELHAGAGDGYVHAAQIA